MSRMKDERLAIKPIAHRNPGDEYEIKYHAVPSYHFSPVAVCTYVCAGKYTPLLNSRLCTLMPNAKANLSINAM